MLLCRFYNIKYTNVLFFKTKVSAIFSLKYYATFSLKSKFSCHLRNGVNIQVQVQITYKDIFNEMANKFEQVASNN